MEAALSSETKVNVYRTARRHVTYDITIYRMYV
jgi:hypothetical protein